MPEAFSFNREFDFVRMDGLRRMTGRPAHEWDFYIIKELIDNALDADEGIWRKDVEQYPKLKIRVEYAANQLFVEVSNRSIFPASLIPQIFATQQYTSRKAFIKSMTRGALGNALKTLLGIPYALRNRVANDWNPDQKPLVIICAGREYLPTYRIDTIEQSIKFEWSEHLHKQTDGTIIRIAVEYFEQERPRTFAEIRRLAEQYHLSNPNVEFYWDVEIGKENWSMNYAANPNWVSKFRGVAPVQWYSLTAFQDLLGALYREKGSQGGKGELSIKLIGSYFAGFNVDSEDKQDLITDLIEEFGQLNLSTEAVEGLEAKKLYQIACNISPVFDSLKLGLIGKEHIRATMAELLSSPDVEIFYDIARDTGADPDIPFVIEVAIIPLKEGLRDVWTVINFSPTYDDPFLRLRLFAPIQPGKTLLGLRALLDAYGINEETPAIVFLHLICPNNESAEFSKTEINHLPFKQAMGEVLDRVLKAFNQAQEEKELLLEKTIFDALEEILDALKDDERFVLDQLLDRLRSRLDREPNFTEWLQTPEALERLKSYTIRYQNQNVRLNQRIARPAEGIIVVPVHPDRYFFVLAEHISQEILSSNHANKILYIQVPELESVIIENNWLCQMDMALLRTTTKLNILQESIIQCVVGSEVPILVLRDGDSQGLAMVERMRKCLAERHLDTNRIIDLGLGLISEQSPKRLVEMMPNELANRMQAHLVSLNIPAKFVPVSNDIRRDIREQFEQLLLSYLWEGMSQQLQMSQLLADLDRKLQFTQMMRTEALDRQLQDQLQTVGERRSYRVVLGKIVEHFFKQFLGEHGFEIQALTQQHLQQLEGKINDRK